MEFNLNFLKKKNKEPVSYGDLLEKGGGGTLGEASKGELGEARAIEAVRNRIKHSLLLELPVEQLKKLLNDLSTSDYTDIEKKAITELIEHELMMRGDEGL